MREEWLKKNGKIESARESLKIAIDKKVEEEKELNELLRDSTDHDGPSMREAREKSIRESEKEEHYLPSRV